MEQISKELTNFTKAVEGELASFCTRVNPGEPVRWQRSDGSKSHIVKLNRRVKDADFTISAALVKLALPEEEVSTSQVRGKIGHKNRYPDR